MIVDPPGWRAQSKSEAEVLLESSEGEMDLSRSLNMDGTAGQVRSGTRGVRTTFQPGESC